MKTEAVYKESKKESSSVKSSEVKDDFKREGETVTIRQISNGFIATKNWCEGKGMKKEYKSEEIYYEKNPL